MPEVSDSELNNLRQADKLLRQLLAGKTKDRAEALVKELHPEVRTTADDLAPHLEPIKQLTERFDKFAKSYDDDKADAKFRQHYDRVKSEYEFTDEGMQKVLELMKERTIPDIDAAAALYVKHNPPKQEPTNVNPNTSWGFGAKSEDPDLKLLFTNEDAFAEKETAAVLTEARNRAA